MVYYYRLGYHDWEESPHITLAHNKKFSKSEFDEMVLQSYVVADEKMKRSHTEWFDDWLQEEPSHDKDYIEDMMYKPSVSELYYECVDCMKSEYGFFELTLEHSFIPSNCYNLLNPEELDKNDEELMSIHHRLKVIENRDRKIKNVLNK